MDVRRIGYVGSRTQRLLWIKLDTRAQCNPRQKLMRKKKMDEELYYILLTSVLDGTVQHVVSAGDHKSGHQAMTALKKWFSGNEDQ